MDTTPESIIRQYVEDLLAENEQLFLVEFSFKPGNNIKIFLDGDNGITIDNCIRINRGLYRRIEDAALFAEGDFAIEVSSPGVDQPLKLLRQYKKNIGRNVELMMNDNTKKEGKLLDATEGEITIEEKEGSGKKAVIRQTNVPLNEVKSTKVLVTF